MPLYLLVALSAQCLVASAIYTEDVIWTESRYHSQVRLQLAVSPSDDSSYYLWDYTLTNLSFVGAYYDPNPSSHRIIGDIGVLIVKTAFDRDYFDRHGYGYDVPYGLDKSRWPYFSGARDNYLECDMCLMDVSERAWANLSGGLQPGESETFRLVAPTAHRARGLIRVGAFDEFGYGISTLTMFAGSFAVPAPAPEIPEPDSLLLLASGLAALGWLSSRRHSRSPAK